MPKLAIYIPKKEMKLIDKWRKRLNYSQIFMQALQKEIERIGRSADSSVVQEHDRRIADAADYYRPCVAREPVSLGQFAYEMGWNHVMNCQIARDQLHVLVALEGSEELTPAQFRLIKHEVGADLTQVDQFMEENAINARSQIVREEFGRGYVHGVAEAWRKVAALM